MAEKLLWTQSLVRAPVEASLRWAMELKMRESPCCWPTESLRILCGNNQPVNQWLADQSFQAKHHSRSDKKKEEMASAGQLLWRHVHSGSRCPYLKWRDRVVIIYFWYFLCYNAQGPLMSFLGKGHYKRYSDYMETWAPRMTEEKVESFQTRVDQ